jgi:G3E family GTPase
MKHDLIPATILTGFLGAGKTTLLNHLLTQNHGHKCAIIINEFGAISIDHQLVVGIDEEIVELNNGCLCCRVRGDLIKSLNNLILKKKRFDYVLIETTGLADPGPLVHTFLNPELSRNFRLDSVVTVVDARHIELELAQTPEAKPQIASADIILLNKTDLVNPEQLGAVETRIRRINALARIQRTQRSVIDASQIFDQKLRLLSAPLPRFESKLPGLNLLPTIHSDHEHRHDDSVQSVYWSEEKPLDMKKTEAWLSGLVNTHGNNVYRCKGILYIKGQGKRVVFQGVQKMFEAEPDRFWNPGEKRESQLVFIGKDLDFAAMKETFQECISAAP